MQASVARYAGTLLQVTIGDKGSYAYVNFGALSAHEDDARRAVKTALELRKDRTLARVWTTQKSLQISQLHKRLYSAKRMKINHLRCFCEC